MAKRVVLFLLLTAAAQYEGFALCLSDSLRTTVSDTLIHLAESYLARGNTSAAEEIFQNLINQRNDPRAYLGIGKVLLIREDWGEARHQFDKTLELDPTTIEAHYYGGIAYRETGKWRKLGTYGVSIGSAYARSHDLFRWVLEHDSTYRDVLYQYTLLLKDQGRYGEAMHALCAQIRLKPDLPVAYPALVRLCRAAIHEKREVELWSQIRPPLTDLESYVRAEGMQHEGRLGEAEKLLSQLVQSPTNIPPQLAYLSLVRIYASRGEEQLLEETYWRAASDINSEAGAALVYEDLKYFLNPAEMADFSRLAMEEKRDEFFPSIWNRRNPTLAAPSDSRLREHYRRLVYAEQNYYLDRERFSPYVSFGFLGFNFEFKDIGLVYIRHGPPREVLRATGSAIGGIETWLYSATSENPEMMFHFAGQDKSFTLMGGLQSGAGAEMGPNSPRPDVDRKIQGEMTPLRFGGDRRPQTLPADLAFWDPNYFRLQMAKAQDEPSRASASITEKSGESLRLGMTSETRFTPKDLKTIALPTAVSAFRGKAGNSLLEVGYVIPRMSLLKEAGDSVRSLEVESGFAIYDERWRKVVSVAETLTLSRSDPASNTHFRLHRSSVKLDTYYVATYARPLGFELLSQFEQAVSVPDYSQSGLSMSDLQLAFEIKRATGIGMFNKSGLRVVLNPLHKHTLHRPLYVYFEIYSAAKYEGGGSQLDLDINIRPSKSGGRILSGILSLFGEKKGYFVSSEVERWRSDGVLVKYLEIDVTRMEPGEYVLEIKVTDRIANQTVSRSVDVQFVGAGGAPQ